MHDCSKPAGYQDALRAAYIAAGIALADLLLTANYFIAYAVQPEAYDSRTQTMIIVSLGAILAATLSFSAMAAGYAWTYTIWPHDD